MEPFRLMTQREEILAKSEELFFRYGIKSVSMDDLARELGISKKTLYQYFENKADLVHQIANIFLEREKEMSLRAKMLATDAIHEMLIISRFILRLLRRLAPITMYDLKKYYREVWELIETHSREQIFNSIRMNIQRGVREGLYHASVNADIVARLYVGKSIMITDEEMFASDQYRRDELFEQYLMYHIRGIAAKKGLQVLEKHLKDETH